jgi:MYXO-CTERM domain-containing protein
VRQQRATIKVLKVGPANYPGETVPPNDFLVGESICSGDSGGPALATDTGAVIGVVSRGGNGKAPDPNNPAAECIGAMNFYASTAPFKDMILQAFTEAGHDPWFEGGPDPRLAKTGEPCTQDAECRSNMCITVDQVSFCTADCSADPSVCPTGYDCKAQNGGQQCVPHKDPPPAPAPTTIKVGCAVSAGSAGSDALMIVVALGAALGTLRRRTSRRSSNRA